MKNNIHTEHTGNRPTGNRQLFLITAIMIGSLLSSYAQPQRAPEPGKPMPDFRLERITHFSKKSASRDDFKGKWLFLEFWSSTCSTCIQSMPRLSKMYTEFKEEINWIMVGYNDKRNNGGIEQLYEKLRQKQDLKLVVAYDSVLADKWEIHSVPHLIITDPSGIVLYVTDGRNLTAERIREILKGNPVDLYTMPELPAFNPIPGGGTDDKSMIYYSSLKEWNGEKQYGGYTIDRYLEEKVYRRRGYYFAMIPLSALYNVAYAGGRYYDVNKTMIYPSPVLELKDTSRFVVDFYENVGKGTYNYSLSLPEAAISKEMIMNTMQEDLKRALGYNASLELREMQVWRLIAEPAAKKKLKTKGGPEYVSSGSSAVGFTLRNVPSEVLFDNICFFLHDKYKEPFINDTGIEGNIDFSMDTDMTSLQEVQRELQKKGLDIVKGTRQMKVIVIRDK